MEIVAFNADDRADGSGKAKITWISKDLLNTAYKINSNNLSEGGWENCEMRTYLKNTIKPLIPETVRNAIVPVTKIQMTVINGARVKDGQTSTEDVWIPSYHEISPTSTSSESVGATYTIFPEKADRIKNRSGYADEWWLRSAYTSTAWYRITASGATGQPAPNTLNYIALGFCT